jgi:hypothetical protein
VAREGALQALVDLTDNIEPCGLREELQLTQRVFSAPLAASAGQLCADEKGPLARWACVVELAPIRCPCECDLFEFDGSLLVLKAQLFGDNIERAPLHLIVDAAEIFADNPKTEQLDAAHKQNRDKGGRLAGELVAC